ncbi:hypothetical protein ACU6U9_08245 [Pseudomonas sp. HK3]
MTFITQTSLSLLISLFAVTVMGSNIDSKFDVLNDDLTGDHEQHEAEEKRTLELRIASLKNAKRFSCQLNTHYSQCREYPINASLNHKLNDLKEGCESLTEAQFKSEACPSEYRIARCKNIQLDYHDPQSLIYDNHYYSNGQQAWSESRVTKTCLDLEGQFAIH